MRNKNLGSGNNIMSTVLSDLLERFNKSRVYVSEMFENSQTRIEERLGLSESFALQFALVPIKIPKDANKLEKKLTRVLGNKINRI